MSTSIPLTEDDLRELYLWVDDIPLSRPKRNIARDFSDGICVAEVVKHFFPKLVELHNYAPANSTGQKITNWNTLNARVFRKLHFEVPAEEVRDITACVPGAIERFLRALRTKINQIKSIQDQKLISEAPAAAAANQHHHRFPMSSAPPPRHSHASDRPSSAAADRRASPPLPVAPSSTGSSMPGAAATSVQGLKQLLEEKDLTILELRESVALLTDKVSRLEELVRVKDEKIQRYKLQLGR